MAEEYEEVIITREERPKKKVMYMGQREIEEE